MANHIQETCTRKGRAEVTFNELLEAVAEKLIQILGTSAMSSAKAAVGTATTAISPLFLGTVTLKHKIKGGTLLIPLLLNGIATGRARWKKLFEMYLVGVSV